MRQLENNTVNVRFFGENTADNISADNYCPYSEKCPDEVCDGDPDLLVYKMAIEVCIPKCLGINKPYNLFY